MPSTTIGDPHGIFSTEIWSPRLLLVTLALAACALGLSIALEKWLFVAAAVTLLLLSVWPIEVCLGLYALLIPFESMTATESGSGPSTTLIWYAGAVAILVILGVGWLRKRMVVPPRAARFWSLFILWSAVSSMWAIDSDLACRRLPTAIGLWLLYMAVVSVRITAKELSRITLLTILGGCCASAYAAYTFFRIGGGIGRGSLGVGSAEADPNFFAMTLLLPFSLAFGEVLSSRTLSRRALFLVGMGIIALAVFLTMSRGGLLAVLAITLVFLVRLRLNWRLMLPVIALGTALLFMPRMFFERVQGASESRIGGRLDIWEAGLHSLKSYGLFGAGLENFPNAYDEYAGEALLYGGGHRDAHNIYISTWVELGIFGIFLLLAAVASDLRRFSRAGSTVLTSARFAAFEATCWGMLVGALSLDLLWRKAFWLAWALPIMAINASRETEDTDSQ